MDGATRSTCGIRRMIAAEPTRQTELFEAEEFAPRRTAPSEAQPSEVQLSAGSAVLVNVGRRDMDVRSGMRIARDQG